MTPLTHAGAGAALVAIAAPVIRKAFKTPYRALVPISIIAGIAPDIDGLPLLASRAAYFGKEWYSHHMAGHSLAGAAVFSTVIAISYIVVSTAAGGLVNLFRRDKLVPPHRIRRFCGAWLAAFIACATHLAFDLPTPPGPWGGVALMWPDRRMFGGWSRVNWHNWYFIYVSLAFLAAYLPLHAFSGLVSAIPFRITRWTGAAGRVAAAVIAAYALHTGWTFYRDHDFAKTGAAKWDAQNRALVSPEYMKYADRYTGPATVFWRRSVVTMADVVRAGNLVIRRGEETHRAAYRVFSAVLPAGDDPAGDMKSYRVLQDAAAGMEDPQNGDYRVWIVRDALPRPDYYNRGFLLALVHATGRNVLQMTNARMIAYRIEARDSSGRATAVKRIYYSDKIFVSDRIGPQINRADIAPMSFRFWEHDGVRYNLIPGSGYTRHRNLAKGYYLSISSKIGDLWPGGNAGILIHDGPWSAGCVVAAYIHGDIGRHVQYPFYRFWERADELIDIAKQGCVFRGRKIFWGSMLFVRDPGAMNAGLSRNTGPRRRAGKPSG